MTTQLSASNLSIITHANQPVITTELLAKLYDTDPVRIRQNHNENKARFVEGKHFFKVVGDDLKNLRVALNYSQNSVSPKTRSLILWTERGAARHAKMLETDQAWNVFEKLEDHYFNQKTTQDQILVEPHVNPLTVVIPTEGRWLIAYRNGKHQIINVDGHNVVDVGYIQKLQRDSNLLIELLQDYRRRTQVLQGDKSGDILNVPLIK